MEETRLTDSSVIGITHPILPNRERPGIGYIDISMDDRHLTRYLYGLEELNEGRVLLCAPDFTQLLPVGCTVFHENKGDEDRYIVDGQKICTGNLQLISMVPVKISLGPLVVIKRAALSLIIFMIATGVLLSTIRSQGGEMKNAYLSAILRG
jgi:hypothetical protein